MSKELSQIYKEICATAWLTVDEKGIVHKYKSPNDTSKTDPFMVNDNTDHNKNKILVLPIQENLVNLDQTKYIVMHPLAENITKGESPVTAKLRRMMSIRLNYVVAELMLKMLTFAASPALHHTLKPDQLSIMGVLAKTDEQTVKVFDKLLQLSKNKNTFHKSIVSIYLSKGATIKDKTYKRGSIVKFPLYEEIIKNNEPFEMKGLRKKDREIFKKLFEHIFPGIETSESYNIGTNSNLAPFMDVLMKTFKMFFNTTNEVIEKYKEMLGEYESLVVPLDWSEEFIDIENLSNIVRLVPPQRGNDGNVKLVESKEHKVDMKDFKSTADTDMHGNKISFTGVTTNIPTNTLPVTQPTQLPPVVNTPTVVNTPVTPQVYTTGYTQSISGGHHGVESGKISFSSLTIASTPMQNFNMFTNTRVKQFM